MADGGQADGGTDGWMDGKREKGEQGEKSRIQFATRPPRRIKPTGKKHEMIETNAFSLIVVRLISHDRMYARLARIRRKAWPPSESRRVASK